MVVAKNPKSGRGFSHTKEIEFSTIDWTAWDCKESSYHTTIVKVDININYVQCSIQIPF